MNKFLVFICLSMLTSSFSQTLPDNRKTDWSRSGYEGKKPCALVNRNAVIEFGIDNTGNIDVTARVNNALRSINDGEALYFPNGTYLFRNAMDVPSKRVVRGESPINTVFKFDFASSNTCIDIFGRGATGISARITEISPVQGTSLTVANSTGFRVGDDIEISQENDDLLHSQFRREDLQSWASDLKGQFAKILQISGNIITLDRTLTYAYDLNFTTTLIQHQLTEYVGLESFKIWRASNNGLSGDNNNVWIAYAKNCWVDRIYSEYCSRYHFRVEYCRNIEINGCFLDKAYSCGSSGAGYGILTQDHASDNLFQNNIARALRHPWIAKEGSSRNVYAYNYSSGTTQGTDCDADPLTNSFADISLHGHYAAFNLFEGNVVYRITSSDFWGPSAPGNTFFRNRVIGRRGIAIQQFSVEQNVIGNELTFSGATFSMDADGTIGNTTLNKGNVRTNVPLDAVLNNAENSFYLAAKPGFYGNETWPSIGPGVAFNSRKIPAQLRFESENYFDPKPTCDGCLNPANETDSANCRLTSTVKKVSFNQFSIYPNPSEQGFKTKAEKSVAVSVYSLLGEQVFTKVLAPQDEFGASLQKGTYLVKVESDSNVQFFKVVKE